VSDGIRGIVLGADAERLVLRATPAEVARFTLHEAVHVLRLDGMRLVPDERAWLPYEHRDGRSRPSRVVILRTACGCEREQVMEEPLPHVYTCCLATSLRPLVGDPENVTDPGQVTMKIRRFELTYERRKLYLHYGLPDARERVEDRPIYREMIE